MAGGYFDKNGNWVPHDTRGRFPTGTGPVAGNKRPYNPAFENVWEQTVGGHIDQPIIGDLGDKWGGLMLRGAIHWGDTGDTGVDMVPGADIDPPIGPPIPGPPIAIPWDDGDIRTHTIALRWEKELFSWDELFGEDIE